MKTLESVARHDRWPVLARGHVAIDRIAAGFRRLKVPLPADTGKPSSFIYFIYFSSAGPGGH